MDRLSRRAWLMSLGGVPVLTGFAGVEGDTGLPPGLYEPSLDHLAHMRALEGRGEFPAGAETDFVKPETGPYQPAFFSKDEFETITRLVELLLGEPAPKPDTIGEVARWIDLTVSRSAAVRKAALGLAPAHRTLAIHYHGEAAVRELETKDPQTACRDGLEWLGPNFKDLGQARQLELLPAMSEARKPFFELLKRETIRGFYTSREGLSELDYKGNSFYTISPGCEHPEH